MKTLHGFIGYWIALSAVVLSLSCSQGSSQLSPQKSATTAAAVDGVEDATGIDGIKKPSGELDDNLTVKVNRYQISDANLLVRLRGEIIRQSAAPLAMARWSQIDGPPASILQPNQLETLVLTPDVTEPTELTFRLYGVNTENFANAATTTVIVQPPADEADARVISAAINESQSAIDFTVALSKPASVPISVSYKTIDRTAVAQEDYLPVQGILTFAVGETRKIVTVQLQDDDEEEGSEYFELNINGSIPDDRGDKPVNVSGVGVIADNEYSPSFPTTVPTDLGPADAQQPQLPSTTGDVRIFLEWLDAAENLDLVVVDPCGQSLYSEQPTVDCIGGRGDLAVDPESPWENAFWGGYAPPGTYVVKVEHFAGLPTDYDVRIYYGDQTRRFIGTLGTGDRVEVFRFDYSGSESDGSSSSSIESSSSVASSSVESSSSVASSSVESSSSVASSSVESSSSVASSSVESSSSVASSSVESSSSVASSSVESSSSVASSSVESSSVSSSSLVATSSSEQSSESSAAPIEYPQVHLDIAQSLTLTSAVMDISGTLVADPAQPIELITGVLSSDGESLGSLPISSDIIGTNQLFTFSLDLSQGNWSLTDGSYEFYLEVRDSGGRSARSEIQQFTLNFPDPVAIDLISPLAQVYYGAVNIEGSVSADASAELVADISLRYIDGENARDVTITLDENNRFFYPVTEPGDYVLQIVASDGVKGASQEVRFSLIIPSLQAELDSSAPVDQNDRYVVFDSLPLSAQVTANIPFEPNQISLELVAGDAVLQTFVLPIADVWQPATQSLTTSLPFNQQEIPLGDYGVQLSFQYGENQTLTSNDLAIRYRNADPLNLILEPVQGTAYFAPVTLAGQVSADDLRTLTVTAALDNVNDEFAPELVTLRRQGRDFSYTVDVPGEYQFTVNASDGVEQASETVSFVYQQPAVSVSASHQHPLDNLGALDLVGALSLDARITTNSADTLGELFLDLVQNDNLAASVVVDLAELAQTGTFAVPLVFDFTEQQLTFGDYVAQLRVSYGNGEQALSAPLTITYRQLAPLTLQLTPVAEQNFVPVLVAGLAAGDPSRPLDISATLNDLNADTGAQAVTLDRANGAFSYLIATPGRYSFTVVASDGVESRSQTLSVNYAAPVVDVTLEHSMPTLDGGAIDLLDLLTVTAQVSSNNRSLISAMAVQIDGEDGWRDLMSVDLDNIQSDDFSREILFPFSDSDTLYGRYAVRVMVNYAGDQAAVSNELELVYRDRQPLILTIDELGGELFFAPVTVAGSVSADPLGNLSLQATLDNELDDAPPEAITVSVDANRFALNVTDPGRYLVEVTASDGLNTPITRTIGFEFQLPNAEVEIQHNYPELADGSIETLGPLAYTAVISSNNPGSLNALSLEFDTGEGWSKIADLELADMVAGQLSSRVNFIDDLDFGYGTYSVRLRLDYADSAVAYSESLAVIFREATPLSLNLVGPSSDPVYAPVTLQGVVNGEPLRSVRLTATLDNLADENPAQSVNLVRQDNTFSYTLDQVGRYEFSVTATDEVDSITRRVAVTYDLPAAAIRIEHTMPLLDGGAIDTLARFVAIGQIETNNPVLLEGLWLEYDTGDGWETLQNVGLNENFDLQSLQAAVDFHLADSLVPGSYSLRLRLTFGGGQVALSEAVTVSLREPQAISLDLVDFAGQTLYSPVELIGSVSADVLLTLDLQATLQRLDTQAEAQPVALARNGNSFRYAVDLPGVYEFSVSASDGLQTLSRSTQFTYESPDASISIEHNQPVLDNGAIDTLGDLRLIGHITSNNIDLLRGLVLEYSDEGSWVTLVDPGLGENFDPENMQANVDLNLGDLLSFGEYRLRLRLVFGEGQSAVSAVLPVSYRAANALAINFDEGFDGVQRYQPFEVTGRVNSDRLRLANLQLSAQLLDSSSSVAALPVAVNGEVFSVTIEQPGQYRLSVLANDGVDTVTQTIDVNYAIPNVRLELTHDHPEADGVLDLIGNLSLAVQVASDVPVDVSGFSIETVESASQGQVTWRSLIDFAYSDVWESERDAALLDYRFGTSDGPGIWSFRVRADVVGYQPVYSDIIDAFYRFPATVAIVLDSPTLGGSYYSAVPVLGSVAWETQLPLQLSATLDNLDDSAPAQAFPVTVSNGSFSGSVSNPGNYQLTVNASDGNSQDSVTAQFVYIPSDLTIDAEPQHPVDSDGLYSVTGDLLIYVTVDADPRLPLQSFELQESLGDGQWQTLQSYDYGDVWQGESLRAELSYSFANNDQGYGRYPFRVQLTYADSLLASSATFDVNYRAYEEATLTLLNPGQESTLYGPVDIVVAISGDPTANLSVTGILDNTGDEGPALPIEFAPQSDGNYGYTVTDPGVYELQINLDDDNTQANPDAAQSLLFSYIDPQIDLLLNHDHPLLDDGALDLYETLDLSVGLTSNVIQPPSDFQLLRLGADGAETVLQTYPASQVWDAQSRVAQLSLDFASAALEEGGYELVVAVRYDNGLRALSEILPVQYRRLAPLTVTIQQPGQNEQFTSSVSILGSATGDSALPIELNATLVDLDNEIGPQPVTLARQGEQFRLQVDQPGRYRFSVSATDGRRSDSASVDFRYAVAALAINLTHNHPLNDDGGLDTVGPLAIDAAVVNPQQYPLDQLALEILLGDSWQELTLVDLSDGQAQAQLTFNLNQLDIGYGAYPLRARVDYLAVQSSYSANLTVQFRQAQLPRITELTAPVQGLNLGRTLPVIGSYQLDPLAQLNGVSATFYVTDDGAEALLFGPLPIAADGGVFRDQVDHDFLGDATEVELIVADSLGGQSEPLRIPLAFVRSSDLFVSINEPALDVFATVNPWVDINANFYVGSGLNYAIDLRMLDASGNELLREQVTGSETWQITDPGNIQGQFNFAQIANLVDGNYTVEMVVSYEGGPSVRDSFVLSYAVPNEPGITIVRPQAQSVAYSFTVEVFGTVTVDERLGFDSISGVFASLDLVGPDSVIVNARIPLSFANGQFIGQLSENLLSQSGDYIVNVWAEDSQGRTSPADSARFTYEVPADLSLQLRSPVVPPTGAAVDQFNPQMTVAGTVQFQPGYPVEDLRLSVLQGGEVIRDGLDLSDSMDTNSGAFSQVFDFEQADLAAGSYVLRIAAADSEERVARVDIPVNFAPLSAPTLTDIIRLPPGDDAILSGSFEVAYTVDPRVEDAAFDVRLISNDGNGVAIDYTVTEIPQPDGSGRLNFSINDRQLNAGNNRIVVTLNDGQNPAITASLTIDFRVPEVTIIAPDNNASLDGRAVSVQFQVTYAGVVTEPARIPVAQLRLNGTVQEKSPASVPGTLGVFSYNFAASELVDGENLVDIQVIDFRNSSVVSDNARVTFQFSPLVLTLDIVEPAADSAQEYTGNVRVQYTSNVPLVSASYSVNDTYDGEVNLTNQQPPYGYSIIGEDRLHTGINTLVINAVDLNGNNLVATRNFNYRLGQATGFDVDFAYPYLANRSVLLRGTFDQAALIDSLQVVVNGNLVRELTQQNLTGGVVDIEIPLTPEIVNLAGDSLLLEIELRASNAGFEEVDYKLINLGQYDERSADDTLLLDLGTQVEMGSQGSGLKIFHGNLTEIGIPANQHYFAGTPFGDNIYYLDFPSPFAGIQFGVDPANGVGSNLIEFGPKVLPENIRLSRIDRNLGITLVQDLSDPSASVTHQVYDFFQNESVFKGMLFADGTLWTTDDILATIDRLSPPTVSIPFPKQNQILNAPVGNLQFVVEWDNPDDGSTPNFAPDCTLTLNDVLLECGIGIRGNEPNSWVVVTIDAKFNQGANRFVLDVFDYRDKSLSTRIVRDFTYDPADITLRVVNADNSALPLNGGDAILTYTSDVQLSSASILVNNQEIAKPRLQDNQSPYSYSYTIPARYFNPGRNTVEVIGRVVDPVFSSNDLDSGRALMSVNFQQATLAVVSPLPSRTYTGDLPVQISITNPGKVGVISVVINRNGVNEILSTATVTGTTTYRANIPSGSLPFGTVSLNFVYQNANQTIELARVASTFTHSRPIIIR